jgi:hypothetical protein
LPVANRKELPLAKKSSKEARIDGAMKSSGAKNVPSRSVRRKMERAERTGRGTQFGRDELFFKGGWNGPKVAPPIPRKDED